MKNQKNKQISGLACPHCQKPVGFGKQMQEWDSDYGQDVPSDEPEKAWAYIAVWCHNCDQYAYGVDVSAAYTEEENAPENLKKAIPGATTIAFPKSKKPKN